MNMLNVISAILKKVVPDFIGAAVPLVTVYWMLQVSSTALILKNIISITTTIFIVLYLAITLLGKYLEVIDGHQIQQAYKAQIASGIALPQIVDANLSHHPISAGFSNISSYSHHHRQNSKNILTFARIFLGIVVIICTLGSVFVYFHFIKITISLASTTSSTSPIVAANPWSDWQTIPNKCSISGKAYRVNTPSRQDLNACYGPKTWFKNFTYEVTMTILKGHCGGLLFRKPTHVNNYYVFQVCQDKTYALLKYINDAGKNFQPFFGVSKDNRAITPGLEVTNIIAVTAKESAFALSINHLPVATIQDTSYSQGTIGLVASSDLYGDATEIVYQNLKINNN